MKLIYIKKSRQQGLLEKKHGKECKKAYVPARGDIDPQVAHEQKGK